MENVVVVPGVANQKVVGVEEGDGVLRVVHDVGAREHISPFAQQDGLPPALFVEKDSIELPLLQPLVEMVEVYRARLVDHWWRAPGHKFCVPLRVADGAAFSTSAINEYLVPTGKSVSILSTDVPRAGFEPSGYNSDIHLVTVPSDLRWVEVAPFRSNGDRYYLP